MDLQIVGLNHKTAPVEVREALALPADAVAWRLQEVVRLPGVQEAAILSTCNRVELIAAGGSDLEPSPFEAFLAGMASRPLTGLGAHLYVHRGAAAARHLFEVASSIDSLVIGETEILGQVKTAYQLAQSAGTAGRVLHAAFQQALRVAKEIHATTRLGARRVSVGSVAAEFAEKIFASLAGKTVLVIGAGEMAEATAKTLGEAGARDLRITNRTAARAEDLAGRVGGRAVPFERLEAELPSADVVLACAAADPYLLGPPAFTRALHERRHRPIVVIDIAVPRSIDPAAGDLDALYLFNIDDLEAVVKANLAARQEEIARCQPLIEEAVRALEAQQRGIDLGPFLARLRERSQFLAAREMERILAAMPSATPAQRAEVEVSVRRLAGRFMHDQTVLLKAWAQGGASSGDLDSIQRLLEESGRDAAGSGRTETLPGPSASPS
jgi:glutamyl-tRNA reductase